MDLVKTEIERLNKEVSSRGSVSMVFHSGGTHVCFLGLPSSQKPCTLHVLTVLHSGGTHVCCLGLGFTLNPKTLNPVCSYGLPLWRNARVLLEFLWS